MSHVVCPVALGPDSPSGMKAYLAVLQAPDPLCVTPCGDCHSQPAGRSFFTQGCISIMRGPHPVTSYRDIKAEPPCIKLSSLGRAILVSELLMGQLHSLINILNLISITVF